MTITDKLSRRLRRAAQHTDVLDLFLREDAQVVRKDAGQLTSAVIALGEVMRVIAEISEELNVYAQRSKEMEDVADVLHTEIINSSLVMQNMMKTFLAYDPVHVAEFLNTVDLNVLLVSMDSMEPAKLEALKKGMTRK